MCPWFFDSRLLQPLIIIIKFGFNAMCNCMASDFIVNRFRTPFERYKRIIYNESRVFRSLLSNIQLYLMSVMQFVHMIMQINVMIFLVDVFLLFAWSHALNFDRNKMNSSTAAANEVPELIKETNWTINTRFHVIKNERFFS